MWSENTENNMNNTDLVRKSLKKRYLKERLFKAAGMFSIGAAILFLLILLTDIITKAMPAFTQTNIELKVELNAEELGLNVNSSEQEMMAADFRTAIRNSLLEKFPEVSKRNEKRELYSLTSMGAEFQLRDMVMAKPSLIGQTLSVKFMADDDVDAVVKGAIDRNLPESDRRVKDQKLAWIEQLENSDLISTTFNWHFFSSGDSREPEMAGIKGAIIGSFYTLLVTLALSFPVAVAAAIYLEEFAPKNRFIDFIEININNLAAVPSIVFGLLGLAVFINFFGLPRSAPLIGGIVLSLMTLPTIIIASRSAIKAVPPSLREAALGLGASKMQTVFHHVLPAALPGILTGTIIGMAQALGETAPLLMIGMVAFIVDIPQSVVDPSTVLPIQVYLWADSPERGFLAKTSAAILVLLFFLIAMNAVAIYLRKKFEKKW
jgi:phosphate transport system permease protein